MPGKAISVKIIKKITPSESTTRYAKGVIKLGDFREPFNMPLNWWDIDTYKKQWQEGITRIRKYKHSCLITEVYNPTKDPVINMWALYRRGTEIIIHNYLLFGPRLKKKISLIPFNTDSCYRFIPRKRKNTNSLQLSEWIVSAKDV